MSDLISRKAVLDEIHKYFRERIDHGIYEVDVADCSAHISKRIDKLPTAFDVDKVVEQLETSLETNTYYSKLYDLGIKHAISIVKGGGQG
jgi:hypothetical protein